jgi:hypothetical protein
MDPSPNSLLRLSPEDNVLIVIRPLDEGTCLTIDGVSVELGAAITLGHKIAARQIRQGEKILKYNASIGSATCDIGIGEHVHLHNMKSDYLPTYTREKGNRYGQH